MFSFICKRSFNQHSKLLVNKSIFFIKPVQLSPLFKQSLVKEMAQQKGTEETLIL